MIHRTRPSTLVVEHILAAHPEDRDSLVASVLDANGVLLDAMRSDPSSVGMGSTVAAALVSHRGVIVANIGDSSTFEFAHRRLIEMTTSDAAAVGALPGLPAGGLNQVLGGAPERRSIESHVYQDDLPAPRRLLLCTDGLTNFVPRHEIVEVLSQLSGECAVSALVALALEAGGFDNVTVVLLEME